MSIDHGKVAREFKDAFDDDHPFVVNAKELLEHDRTFTATCSPDAVLTPHILDLIEALRRRFGDYIQVTTTITIERRRPR